MSDASPLGLPAAARHFGVPVRVLRHAIRSGRIPGPSHLSATSILPAEWLVSAEAALEASPKALGRSAAPKVAPFARYHGTSAWRKYANRVRAYARFRATTKLTNRAAATPSP